MPKTRSLQIPVKRYFPSNNPLAVKMARMCIVIEDYNLESMGYLAEKIQDLDQNSSEFRGIYFLRNAIGSALELKNAIDCIRKDSKFQTFVGLQSADKKSKYERLYSAFNQGHKRLKDIRNEFGGGHVLDKAVRKGLNNIEDGEVEIFQISETQVEKTHFKFTHLIANRALAVSILGSNGSQKDLAREFQKLVDAMVSGRNLSHLIFSIYLKEMALLPKGK